MPARVREPPAFSRLATGLRVGADWFEREGLALRTPEVRGVVDRLEDLAHPGFSREMCGRVHPEVRRFFERTADLEIFIETRWHALARPAWWLARPLMGWLGQLFLPWREARITTRVLALDRARDGRADARGVVRTYRDGPVGRAMQVFAYATLARDGVRYMSAAIPLPLGNLAGLLRLDPNAAGDVIDSVALTSRPDSQGENAGGVWFATRYFALPLPFTETLTFYAADSSARPSALDPARVPGCTLLAVHEQRLLGVLVATHHYWFYPSG